MDHGFILDARSQAERGLREWLRDNQRHWIALSHDMQILKQFSKRPDLLLQRLAKRNVLIPLGGGIYVLPATDPLVCLHARMQPLGEYMASYRTGMISHGLLDGNLGNTINVAVPGSSISRGNVGMGNQKIQLTRMVSEDKWFGQEIVQNKQGWYVRSNKERLLVDILDRPKISGSVLNIRDAWAQALKQGVDYDKLLDYSIKFGQSSVRRVGWWLDKFGKEESLNFVSEKGKSGAVVLDAGKQYMEAAQWQIDKRWGIKVNIPDVVWKNADKLL